MARLFVTDMDGTLLDNETRVSELSSEIISRLSRDGAFITVATARTPATVEPLLSGTFTAIPAIVMTGAAMWDRREQRFFNVRFLPAEIIPDAIRMFRECSVSPFVYTLPPDGLMTVFHERQLTPHENRFYIDRAHLKLKRFIFVRDLAEESLGSRCMLLLGISTIEKVEALAALLRDTTPLSVTAYPDIFNPRAGYIEVFAPGVSKAKAVLELKEMLGADSLTVYGDNLNDIPMLRVADDAVAVGNALEPVKSAASRVIGPNSASSVAIDIREHLF